MKRQAPRSQPEICVHVCWLGRAGWQRTTLWGTGRMPLCRGSRDTLFLAYGFCGQVPDAL